MYCNFSESCRSPAGGWAIWRQLVPTGAAHALQPGLPGGHPVPRVQPANLAEQQHGGQSHGLCISHRPFLAGCHLWWLCGALTHDDSSHVKLDGRGSLQLYFFQTDSVLRRGYIL